MKLDSVMDRDECKVYRLGRITFVPHYTQPGVFVGPGYGRYNLATYTERELIRLGATMGLEFLWQRLVEHKAAA